MKKYYIYKDYFLNEEEFIVKAKKDYENEDEDTRDAFTLEEYMEDIFLLDYDLMKILEIDEDVFTEGETISDLDCKVLDMLTKDMSEDLYNEAVQKYIDIANMGNDYQKAINDKCWNYYLFDDWGLVIRFDVLTNEPDDEKEYTKVKYKSFKITKD